ncbi:MAG: TolC family protein [Candidatus Omnitrophota bacterium]
MKKVIVFIIIALFFSRYSYSQDTLTWKDCIEKAKKSNPELISASEKVKQARSDKNIEITSILPQVDSTLTGKSAKASTNTTADTYSYSITGQQLIFDGFKTLNNISSSFKAFEAEEYNYMVTSSNIRLNLKSAFVGLLKSQELILLTKDILERRKQNLKLVKLRYEAGREHRGSLLTAEADLSQADFEVNQAERSITLYQRKLSKELGLGTMRSLSVTGEFAAETGYDVKPNVELLADYTPFLKELISKKEASRHDLSSANAEFFPEVYLDGSLGKTSATWPPENDVWSYGMSVSLPIFEGGSRFLEVSKAKSKLRQAEADEKSGRDSVLFTLESTWKDLKDAIATVSVKEKFLEAAAERAKIASSQYETGLLSFDDWIIIEDNLVNAKKAYLNAKADLLLTESYWIQAIGGTLDYDKE